MLNLDLESRLPDALFQYLGTLGYTGTLNDRQYQFLKARGFEGSMDDMITAYGGQLSNYIASTLAPTFVWDAEKDFHSNQVAGDTPDNYVTMTTPSVVRDVDGNLKWSAHNILTRSPPDAAVPTGWGVGFGTGTYTHTLETSYGSFGNSVRQQQTVSGRSYLNIDVTLEANAQYTCEVWFDPSSTITGGSDNVAAILNLTGISGDTGITISEMDSNGFGSFTFSTASDAAGNFRIGAGVTNVMTGDLIFSGWQLYRSDLGGMQNNPDRTDSYVPTTSAAIYKRAIEYDISNNRLGVLIEPARTNLVVESEDFADVAWGKFETVVSDVTATSPAGLAGATKFVDDASTGTGGPNINDAVTVATSSVYTFSVYAKKDQLNWITLRTVNFTTPANSRSYFDLDNGVVGTGGTGHTLTMTDEGNGWYRCSITFTTDASDTAGNLYLYIAEADLDTTVDLDGTSSILIYGAQFELGAFPTSYIPTVGATRVRDVVAVSVPKANVGTDTQLTEGTWFMKARGMSDAAGDQNMFDVSEDGSTIIALGGAVYTYNSSAFLSATAGTIYGDASHKVAVSFKDGTGRSITYDGKTVVSDANNYLATNPPANFYVLQRSNQTAMTGGVMQHLVFIPQRETDAVIEDKTDAATAYPL